MLHRFQRVRQSNNAELHWYLSQYNPCRKVTVRLHFIGGMLFALPVGGNNIWPIGRGNHGYLQVVTTDWVIHLVCRSLSRTSEKLCMGPGPPKLTHAPWIGVCEQGIDANMGAGCMHSKFQLPVRTMSTGDSASGLLCSSLRRHLEKKAHHIF